MNYFISAIGTDTGKTVVSAILTEALKADYWKPIQSGAPRDTETVRDLVSNDKTFFHQESIYLTTPVSPHQSAKIDGVEVSLTDFSLPFTENQLVVEGAGGLMVPINDQDYVSDLSRRLDLQLVLVCDFYLGSINHTLLSLDYLKNQRFKVKGLIFNGDSNPESERIIMKKSPWPLLYKVPKLEVVNKESIRKQAEILSAVWE